jgi:hypothetical protein
MSPKGRPEGEYRSAQHEGSPVSPDSVAVPAGAFGPEGAAPVPAYRRILLKLSGEALMGDDPYGINRVATSSAAWRRALPGWTAPPPTTWGCWQR